MVLARVALGDVHYTLKWLNSENVLYLVASNMLIGMHLRQEVLVR